MPPDSGDALLARFVRDKARMLHLRLDASGRVVAANAYALDVLGRDIVGKAFGALLVSFTDAIDPIQAAREERTGVLASLNAQDGQLRTFYLSFFADVEAIQVYGEASHEDMQLLQTNLIEINNELSNMARQLQKANIELKKLNDVKNQFLGMAAHDLRTPLGGIMASSNFIIEDTQRMTDEQIEFMELIIDSSQYMLKMLDELLDVVKIESGHSDYDFIETDFVSLVQDSLKRNRALAEKKGIALGFEAKEAIDPLFVDPLKIAEVLDNLLSNALKFSLSGTTVTVRVFRSAGSVTVEVCDQGKGIPQDKLGLIFTPFNRVSSQGTAGERSTGLGLSIAQKIILGHRGNLWVESREGEGSKFFFRLPPRPLRWNGSSDGSGVLLHFGRRPAADESSCPAPQPNRTAAPATLRPRLFSVWAASRRACRQSSNCDAPRFARTVAVDQRRGGPGWGLACAGEGAFQPAVACPSGLRGRRGAPASESGISPVPRRPSSRVSRLPQTGRTTAAAKRDRRPAIGACRAAASVPGQLLSTALLL